MAHTIEIDQPEYPRIGSCGGDSFGSDGLAEINVDGKLWGFLIASHADADVMQARFTWAIESDKRLRDKSLGIEGDYYECLGRRKSNAHALKAATKAVREFLRVRDRSGKPGGEAEDL